MMRLVAHLDWRRFSRRTWVISSGDLLSEAKALALEKKIGTGEVRVHHTRGRPQLMPRSDSSASCGFLAHAEYTNPTSPHPSRPYTRSLTAFGTSLSHLRLMVGSDESSRTSFC